MNIKDHCQISMFTNKYKYLFVNIEQLVGSGFCAQCTLQANDFSNSFISVDLCTSKVCHCGGFTSVHHTIVFVHVP